MCAALLLHPATQIPQPHPVTHPLVNGLRLANVGMAGIKLAEGVDTLGHGYSMMSVHEALLSEAALRILGVGGYGSVTASAHMPAWGMKDFTVGGEGKI